MSYILLCFLLAINYVESTYTFMSMGDWGASTVTESTYPDNAAEVAKAKVEKIIANTNSVADAKAYKAKHNATAIAMKKTAAAYGTAYTKVKTKGFLASDINHLEWAEFFSKHPSSKIHMDLSQPSKLYLDPTQASNHDANMQSNSNDL